MQSIKTIMSFKKCLKSLNTVNLKQWLVAIIVTLSAMVFLSVSCYADAIAGSGEIGSKVKSIAGKDSWIQTTLVVGSFLVGTVTAIMGKIIQGLSVVAVVWGLVYLYNSGLFF